CDLPVKELGVDVANGFKPTYVYDPDKKDVVAKLKALKGKYGPGDILVASDADREGEAIGWHIARTIGLKPAEVRRAEFHEITEAGIKRALKAVRPLDLDLVAAQEARRILDRLVGYTVSPVVRDRLPTEANLSAGRVQSVALRVVVDRELAIRAFVPKEYWSVHARYAWPGDPKKAWESEYVGTGVAGKHKPLPLESREDAEAIAAQLRTGPHQVVKITRKETQRKPAAPFITSTMLQKASSRLKMGTDETTRHAKTLFEKGLVTYIRTDEPSVSPEFQKETLTFLKDRYGAAIVPAKPNIYKAKSGNAQGAHECIRPTRLDLERPEDLDARASALYRLIRETYLASQCKPARYDVTEALLQADRHVMKASGRVLKDPGFLAIFQEEDDEDDEKEDAANKPLPPLNEGEHHTATAVGPKQHWTKAPERFTEATLIKYLEAHGIGRPSTFNAMVSKILQKQFVEKVNKRYLQPTPKGEVLDAELRRFFSPVINENFTAELEEHLDAIASREEQWREYLRTFWDALTPLVATAREGAPGRSYSRKDGANGDGGAKGGEVADANAPPCPKCKQSFTRRIHSAKTNKDYYICGRDSREARVCGFIMGVEDLENAPCPVCEAPTRQISPTLSVCVLSEKGGGGCSGRIEAQADLSGNPTCYRCQSPMKLVASRHAFRCSVDACNTWLDEDSSANAPCPECKGPTRRYEGKGYGCVKWKRDGGEGSCNGFVKWDQWTPPKKKPAAKGKGTAASKRSAAPKKPSVPKKPTTRRKPKAD
ncbi:MAG: type I DNA topoisomerase, partial [Candidatus Sericytochromatia bacterium]